jgi:amino acid adenylation domain-containing protein
MTQPSDSSADRREPPRPNDPPDPALAELFAAQVARAPKRVALVRGAGGAQEQMSYGTLDARADQIGGLLQRHGIGPDAPVAVCLPRSFEFVIAVLGVIKAGGAYVPLDPALPAERLRFMLADTGATVLLTTEALAERLAGVVKTVIRLDADQALLATSSAARPTRPQPENLAYIIYTSGSTGQPKGVQITQAGLLNLIAWHQQTYRIAPDDRATLLSGLGFDASVWELWPYLTAGASLYLPDEELRSDPARLLAWLHTHAMTCAFLPTPLAEVALRLPWPSRSALRLLLTGGDQLHRYPDPSLPCALVNLYGPTETSVVATYALVPAEPGRAGLPPIGRPIRNTEAYILDDRLQPVAGDAPGELYIGGAGVARGYLNAPALTAELFRPDPWSGRPGARLYRTGDLARWLPDGQLEYLGRIDQQIKLRGFRIELGEIEAALQQHPDVQEAIVLLRTDQPDDPRLTAYVVPGVRGQGSGVSEEEHASSFSLQPSAVRAFLAQRLPEYMIPAAFVLLDALPLTPNGKIDRKALPAPEQSRTLPSEPFVAPRTALEEALSQFWIEVLGVERVGVFDSFFELGGHSLLATQIASRVQQVLRVEMPIQQLFEVPTIAGLAQIIRANEPTPGHAEKIAQLLRRIKSMSSADLKQTLDQKRPQ